MTTLLCNIPAGTLPPCDLPWGHDGDMHANAGDGFYARDYLDEHHARQRERRGEPPAPPVALPETTMRALAEAATHGPWEHATTTMGVEIVMHPKSQRHGYAGPIVGEITRAEDAALIAHMDPVRVVALAAVVEAARVIDGAHGADCPAAGQSAARCVCGADDDMAALAAALAALDAVP